MNRRCSLLAEFVVEQVRYQALNVGGEADSTVYAIYRVLAAGIVELGAYLKSEEVNLFSIFRWLTEQIYGHRTLFILLSCFSSR